VLAPCWLEIALLLSQSEADENAAGTIPATTLAAVASGGGRGYQQRRSVYKGQTREKIERAPKKWYVSCFILFRAGILAPRLLQ
jgi:hypothetical protein